MIRVVVGVNGLIPLKQTPDGNWVPGGNPDLALRNRILGFHVGK